MQWGKGEVLKVTGLYLLIIPFLNALNATGYENSQIQGHFGASSVEFMYMNLIPLFVLVAGLPLALELSKTFQAQIDAFINNYCSNNTEYLFGLFSQYFLVYIMQVITVILYYFRNSGSTHSDCKKLQSNFQHGHNVWHCSVYHTGEQQSV